MTSAADRWRDDLAAWAIPDEILAVAPESPWIHPVELFTVVGDVPDSPSHARAREALLAGGSVLDVGCGGGRAALALVPPAGSVVGVDHQEAMLERFAAAAGDRGVPAVVVQGDWPAVAGAAPVCDVVVCHHVAYNVADIVPFLRALDAHARRRVVLELPVSHPLASLSPMWSRFWGLQRPTRPTCDDLLDVAREAGLDARLDRWSEEPGAGRTPLSPEQQARFLRIRLCLPADREPEVRAALAEQGEPAPREVATLWWDPAPPRAADS
jgi:SAM-dependent methyltransferase